MPAFSPDQVIRSICKLNFNINEFSSLEEIEKCVLLEEFKRTDPKDRLRFYGYSMIQLMTQLEESFVMNLVEACYIDHQYIEQVSKTTFKIKVIKYNYN